MFGEIELAVFDANGRSSGDAPGVNALYSQFKRAIEAQGIRVNAAREIDGWIASVSGFSAVTHEQHLFPIGGGWLSPRSGGPMREVGQLMLQNFQRLGSAMKPVLMHNGLCQSQVTALVDGYQRDLVNPALRLWGKYHTVWAIRQ